MNGDRHLRNGGLYLMLGNLAYAVGSFRKAMRNYNWFQ